MSEHQEIIAKSVGFEFTYMIEREIRTTTDAKYPDKKIEKAGLSGHADTFEEAKRLLGETRKELREGP
jgi:hypothetical protein